MEFTSLQKKKLGRLAKALDNKEIGVLEVLEEVESELTSKIEEVASLIPKQPEDGKKGEKGDRGRDGNDGENYVLTARDKAEIAKSITVPVVEKVIEKTIVKEVPIVTNEIVEKTVEVAVVNDAVVGYLDDKIDKLAKTTAKINSKMSDGIGLVVREIRSGDNTTIDNTNQEYPIISAINDWERITRDSLPLIQPVNPTDGLHLGIMTNFAPYAIIGGSKAWFTNEGEAGFFTSVTHGDPSLFLFNAYGNVYGGFRARGTIDSPTSVAAGDGLLSLLGGAFDTNDEFTLFSNGKILYSALQVRAGTPAAGDVPQDIHLGCGIGGVGTIRYNSADQIGFFGLAPITRPTVAIAAGAFVTNTSGILNDTATFDGYTIGQVVKALRNIGILT